MSDWKTAMRDANVAEVIPANDRQFRVDAIMDARRKRIAGSNDESFENLEHSLAHKKGVEDPKALAAYIGRKNGKIK